MRVLLVEDDIIFGEGIRDFLKSDGYIVDWVKTIGQAKARLAEPYDVWLLDWNLPDGSSIDLLASQRRKGLTTPAILLTARDLLSDRIRGLDSGADDYLVKPFEPEELTARLRALARRMTGGNARLHFGPVELDLEAKAVWLDGQAIDLTAREWEILEVLVRRAGRIVPRADIESLLQQVESADTTSNAIDVHIFKLRSKLGKNLVETIRGLGYRVPKSDINTERPE